MAGGTSVTYSTSTLINCVNEGGRAPVNRLLALRLFWYINGNEYMMQVIIKLKRDLQNAQVSWRVIN